MTAFEINQFKFNVWLKTAFFMVSSNFGWKIAFLHKKKTYPRWFEIIIFSTEQKSSEKSKDGCDKYL